MGDQLILRMEVSMAAHVGKPTPQCFMNNVLKEVCAPLMHSPAADLFPALTVNIQTVQAQPG